MAQPTPGSTAPATIELPTSVTSAPTIAPPTAAGGTPLEIAEAELLKTVDAFWLEVDSCLAAPSECDVEAVITTYTADSPVIASWLSDWVNGLIGQNQHFEDIELDQRTMREITVDPSGFALTSQCEVSRSRIVHVDGSSTSVVDASVSYGRYDFTWTKTDGRWVIVESANMSLIGDGDGGCEF